MLEHLTLQDNGVPIYVQLRDQFAAAIGRGELAPGARLPTMREVAVTLAVDLNTVQRAYASLEEDGLVTMITFMLLLELDRNIDVRMDRKASVNADIGHSVAAFQRGRSEPLKVVDESESLVNSIELASGITPSNGLPMARCRESGSRHV